MVEKKWEGRRRDGRDGGDKYDELRRREWVGGRERGALEGERREDRGSARGEKSEWEGEGIGWEGEGGRERGEKR